MTIAPQWETYSQYREDYLSRNEQPKHQLVYLSAPYSKAEDKNKLMEQIMKISGMYQMFHPGQHVVSPLFNHYSLHLVSEMGSDYKFWKDYSINLLRRCDKVIVIKLEGWDTSTGVADELAVAQTLSIPVEFVEVEQFL